MSTAPVMSIYESKFAPSDKTDAILVVDGKKLHVIKAVLSYYSDYFETLFNSDFAKKTKPEIPIKDVKFEDFAALLSLIQDNPIMPTESNCEKLLELADRFEIPTAKSYLELFIISTDMDVNEKLRIANKYQLDDVLIELVADLEQENLDLIQEQQTIKEEIKQKMSTTPVVSIYESTFAPSDKTDAILVVDGKKLHVKKADLSYYSDYFETLFNSDFAKKSMPEIPIKDANFEDFATFLSLIQDNSIMPTESNCERLLELADRFQVPTAKSYLELFIISTDMDVKEKLRIANKYQLDLVLFDLEAELEQENLDLIQELQTNKEEIKVLTHEHNEN